MRSTAKGPQQMIQGLRPREVFQSNNEPARDRRSEEERAEEAAHKARREADARERLGPAGLPVETDNQRAPVYTTGTQRHESVSSRDGQQPYMTMNNHQTSMPATELSRVTAHQLARPDGADSITSMVHVMLYENRDKDPEKSLLYKAGIRLPHPEPYGDSADLEKFEVFIAGILRWLSMNNMLARRQPSYSLATWERASKMRHLNGSLEMSRDPIMSYMIGT
jgi:hypothetical protein